MARFDGTSQWRRAAVAYFAILFVATFLAVRFWRLSPPQLGTDDEVFKTVDALFTALTSRSEKQLEECSQRLTAFRKAGTLPKGSGDVLESIVQEARSGKWEPAAKRLYDFMYGQKRQ